MTVYEDRKICTQTLQGSHDKKVHEVLFRFWNKITLKKIIGKSFHSSIWWGSNKSDVNTTVHTDLDSCYTDFWLD